jgi:SAM-dependent methyltransferase
VPRDVTGDFHVASTDQIPTRKLPKPDFDAVSHAQYASDEKASTGAAMALDSTELVPPRSTGASSQAVAPTASAPADELSALMQNIVSEERSSSGRASVAENRVSANTWYAEVFDDLYLRLLPPNTLSRTRREVEFLTRELLIGPQSSVLDLACGHGRHSIELASRGAQMTGVDLSRVFLERALREAERRSVETRFMVGDMRDINFESRFDAAFCLGTSFGYFDDRTNFEVVSSLFRSLRPGGRLVIETVNRDYITQNVPRRRWWDIEELIVREEVEFNARTSRLINQRTIVDGSTRSWEQHISVRLYAAHELCSMLAMAGFQLLSLCGDVAHPGVFMPGLNRSVIVTAQRPG